MVKVKSRATTTQVLTLGNTVAMLALSELADTVADIFTDHQGDRQQVLAVHAAAEKQLELIYHRIPHIQASVWRDASMPRVSAADVKTREQARGLIGRGNLLDAATAKIMLQDSRHARQRVPVEDSGAYRCVK